MQFLKRHFEKIILSAVLAGLGAAAVWLSVAVKDAQVSLTAGVSNAPPAKAWVEPPLATYNDALQSLKAVPAFSLTGEHNLFNSGTWKRLRDGSLVKMKQSGVEALAVTEIRPLYFSITLDDTTGAGYYLITKHGLGPQQRYFSPIGAKASPRIPYPVVGTNSAPGNPSVLMLQVQIPETEETVSVSAKAPYKSLEGYEVDLKYSASDVTNVFLKRHLEDTLQLSEDFFKIIAVSSNAVTVQDTRTSQKTEKQWNAQPNAVTAQDIKTIPNQR
jgi:hypothetical protein